MPLSIKIVPQPGLADHVSRPNGLAVDSTEFSSLGAFESSFYILPEKEVRGRAGLAEQAWAELKSVTGLPILPPKDIVKIPIKVRLLLLGKRDATATGR